MTPECSVKWCAEPDGHDGLHRRYICELIVAMPRRGSIALTVEAADDAGRRRHPVITISKSLEEDQLAYAVLSWDQLDQLTNCMFVARKSYASR